MGGNRVRLSIELTARLLMSIHTAKALVALGLARFLDVEDLTAANEVK